MTDPLADMRAALEAMIQFIDKAMETRRLFDAAGMEYPPALKRFFGDDGAFVRSGVQFKECTTCHHSKPTEEFDRSFAGRFGVNSTCKDCRRAYMREYKTGVR